MTKTSPSGILFIHYYYPPIHSIGALRNYYFSAYLGQYFKNYWVITTTNNKWLGKDTSMQLQVDDKIIAVTTLDYRTLLSNFRKQTHFPEKAKRGIGKLLVKMNLSFPFNILWGEGGLVYIFFAIRRAIKLVKRNDISVIKSSFMPYSDHVIAFCLKSFFPKLIWIADFRDLHINPDRKNLILYGLQRWFNRKIIAKADLVTTVSKGLAKQLLKYNSRVQVLNNGFDPAIFVSRKEVIRSSKFTFTYTGSLYEGLRDPSLLLQSIRELLINKVISGDHLEIVYAGKDSNQWRQWINRYELQAFFLDYGMVGRHEALALQKKSNVNLLLSWTSPKLGGILTAKLYEYLASGSPIVGILKGEGPDQEMESLLKKLNAGRIYYVSHSNNNDLKEYIVNLYDQWKINNQVYKVKNTAQVMTYSWDQLILEFVKALLHESDLKKKMG